MSNRTMDETITDVGMKLNRALLDGDQLYRLLRQLNHDHKLDRCDDFPMDCERCSIGPDRCTPLRVREALDKERPTT